MANGDPEDDVERLKLGSTAAVGLGALVAAFIAATGYFSAIPVEHHNLALASIEGLVLGGVVVAAAGGKGLALRPARPRPSRSVGSSTRAKRSRRPDADSSDR